MQGIHILRVFDENILQQLRNEFLEECKQFQEFTTNNKFVLGGFGAIGVASSFHNLFIRKIRLKTYKTIKDKLHIVHNGKNIEMFFDRMLLRTAGSIPSRETWHRDITPNLEKEDIVYGGWLNLDDKPNYFSYILNSHSDKKTSTGFVKITKDEHKNFNKVKAKIAVPPGYIILFNQNTIHEITATKLKYDSYRIFHGIRFTNNKNPIFNYNDIIKNQGVPPLPSGQQPPMYAKLHWTNHLNKLLDFSKTIHENCKEEKEMKSTGLKHNVVQRYVKSLKL